ncbi:Imm63 family immunity protein [Pectobacterium zantedeschiae]|uniref:Immunity protein 63 domain-containing protein n=1 Tax=Pectobacterium zantedeschiae TaxID=2034769 RepID=A0A9X8P5Y9_9GAMM|nr:Imm63 family immunity protein [Pectobacterium zantedeschiae]RYC38334.1 hypothetical protein CTN06_18290 [Pectobacterium zantedeschiae]RYC44979.1 hypothetical protein CLR69_08270 [Pectobacterium zantedeschiae]
MKTLEELRAELLGIGVRLGCGVRPNHYFIIPDQPDGVATPYLEIYRQEYHFVVSERGMEIERKVTLSDDEILYWFADCGVRALASDYAASKVSPDEKFRDRYFRRQFYLMLSIKPEWATRKKKEFMPFIQS